MVSISVRYFLPTCSRDRSSEQTSISNIHNTVIPYLGPHIHITYCSIDIDWVINRTELDYTQDNFHFHPLSVPAPGWPACYHLDPPNPSLPPSPSPSPLSSLPSPHFQQNAPCPHYPAPYLSVTGPSIFNCEKYKQQIFLIWEWKFSHKMYQLLTPTWDDVQNWLNIPSSSEHAVQVPSKFSQIICFRGPSSSYYNSPRQPHVSSLQIRVSSQTQMGETGLGQTCCVTRGVWRAIQFYSSIPPSYSTQTEFDVLKQSRVWKVMI